MRRPQRHNMHTNGTISDSSTDLHDIQNVHSMRTWYDWLGSCAFYSGLCMWVVSMYTRIHCSTVQQEFFPYMYEIEYFCLMTRKFDAASITNAVNYTAWIENTISLDVFFLNCNYCAGNPNSLTNGNWFESPGDPVRNPSWFVPVNFLSCELWG